MARAKAPAEFAPHDASAEEALIGGLLLAPDMLHGVRAELAPDDFFLLQHGAIYAAMCKCMDAHGTFDALTLAGPLEGSVPEPQRRLNELAAATPTALHVPIYAALVKRMALRRELVAAAQNVVRYANDQDLDTDEVLDAAQAAVFAVGKTRRRTVVSFDTALSAVFDDIEAERNGEPSALRITTPWAGLNRLVGGFEGKQLIIPAARPGNGKSAMMLQVAVHAARAGLRVLMCSLEMSEREIVARIIAQEMGIPTEMQRDMDDRQWAAFMAWIANRAPELSGITFETGGGLTPLKLLNTARDMRRAGMMDVLIVDYIQLMRSDRRADTRANEVGEISRGLKEIAMELDVPVIAASQLNRDGAATRPHLHYLRDSGTLEQDANMVIFIHDPEPSEEADTIQDGKKEFIVAKNRNGKTGVVPVVWLGSRVKFGDLAHGQ